MTKKLERKKIDDLQCLRVNNVCKTCAWLLPVMDLY